MNCLLHIGTEKTATKTLQDFLDANRSRLRQQGFLYPASAGLKDSRFLCAAAYNLQRRDDFTRWYELSSDAELLAFQQQTIANLRAELAAAHAQNTNPQVIFSCEHLQSRLTTPQEIQRLRTLLQQLGLQPVSVLVYLRNPADLASSLYSTAIKCGTLDPEPPPPSTGYYGHVCNHRNTLQLWGAVFGPSALKPRLFLPTELKNGSIIDDFCAAAGIPFDTSYTVPQNTNESLSQLAIEILRRLNARIPVFIGERPNPLRGDLAGFIEHHFRGQRYSLPPACRQAYDAAFRDSNAWVRARFFPDRPALFPACPPAEQTVLEISGPELDQIAARIASYWLQQHHSPSPAQPAAPLAAATSTSLS